MILRALLPSLQLLSIVLLISCQPTSKIKDRRSIDRNQGLREYFTLLDIESPCTEINDDVDNPGLQIANSLIVKKIHEDAILDFKEQLPKQFSINLKGVRNHKKSTYYHYEYLVHGNKVCDQSLRILFDEEGKMTVVGAFERNISINSSYEWVDLDLDEIEKSEIISNLKVKEISLVSSDNCLKEKDNKLVSITNLELLINGLKYQAEVHNNKILSLKEEYLNFEHASFEAQGFATTFDDNIGQETKKFELKNLQTNSNFLCGKEIITSKANTNQFTQSESRNYDFPVGSVGFRDSSVFANAYSTLEWLNDWGWSNWSTQQINIILDRDEGPVYFPSTDTTLPTIYLPNAMTGLDNMQMDKDVITHELAHHYLYEFWSDISNSETIILHEAVADIFTVAKSGTSCIGERICIEEGSTCINKQCLRNADNSIKYNDDLYKSLSRHLKSQVVSGMLWDAHKSGGIELEQLVSFVHQALPLTPSDASIAQFVNAILIPAKEKSLQSAGDYHCTLIDSAMVKGLEGLISNNDLLRDCGFNSFTLELDSGSFESIPLNWTVEQLELLNFDIKVTCEGSLGNPMVVTTGLRNGVMNLVFEESIGDTCSLEVVYPEDQMLTRRYFDVYQEIELKFSSGARVAYEGQISVTQDSFEIIGKLANYNGFDIINNYGNSSDDTFDTISNPYLNNYPQSCLELKQFEGTMEDGEYILYINNDQNKPWTAYCKGMFSDVPQEYLTLNQGENTNFSQYTAGGSSPGISVRTSYEKVRIDPVSLSILGGDQSFASSEGSLTHDGVQVNSMPFGIAMGCAYGQQNGKANINLTETPFEIKSVYGAGGYRAVVELKVDQTQVKDIMTGGFCGWASASPVYNPFNQKAHIIQLEYSNKLRVQK